MRHRLEERISLGATSNALTVPGQLTAMLSRVKREETEFHGASKTVLLELAIYVLSSHGYSREEYSQAVIVLARYHLASLINLRRPRRCREMIEKENAKPYVRRCSRCGLPITAKESVQTGYGSVCRRRVGASMCHVAQSSDVGRDLHVKNRKGDG